MDSLALAGATWGVRPQWHCPRIVGRAVTVKIKPVGLQQPTQHLGAPAIAAAQPGDIIVIDNTGQRQFSTWGGLLSLSAKLRSEEHTSELQSPCNLVCRLLLEKKKKDKRI